MNTLYSLQATNLDKLNEKSELLDRQEHKYIVPQTMLKLLLQQLSENFDILEHAGKRIFKYENIYFDDNYTSYWQHHQEKRKRFKIRTRHYVDTGVCYLEMKLKTCRYRTDKKRINYSVQDRFTINDEAKAFINKFYLKNYEKKFTFTLSPTLRITNNRITLVHKQGGERITIDFDMETSNGTNTWKLPEKVFILETKTATGNGICDKILRTQGIRPVKACSKYCIGLAQLGLVHKYNTFKPLLRTIQQVTNKIISQI